MESNFIKTKVKIIKIHPDDVRKLKKSGINLLGKIIEIQTHKNSHPFEIPKYKRGQWSGYSIDNSYTYRIRIELDNQISP